MSIISNAVKAARPNLSSSSVATYTSILGSLYKKIWGSGEPDLSKFEDSAAVLAHLKDVPAAKRKTVLSACVVLTGNQDYKKQMLSDVGTYNEDIKSQIMTEKQKESNVSPLQVREVYDQLAARANVIYKKKTQTLSDLLELQQFILMALMSGVYISPRRSLEWCEFKIKNIDQAKDNFLDKNALIFNVFKTAKCYGKQDVACPPELRKILLKWFKINPTEYLLFDSKFQKLTSPKITQMLNKVFGKKVSTNQLRHTYLTGRLAAYSKEQKEVAKTMSDMGSSESVLSNYVRF